MPFFIDVAFHVLLAYIASDMVFTYNSCVITYYYHVIFFIPSWPCGPLHFHATFYLFIMYTPLFDVHNTTTLYFHNSVHLHMAHIPSLMGLQVPFLHSLTLIIQDLQLRSIAKENQYDFNMPCALFNYKPPIHVAFLHSLQNSNVNFQNRTYKFRKPLTTFFISFPFSIA